MKRARVATKKAAPGKHPAVEPRRIRSIGVGFRVIRALEKAESPLPLKTIAAASGMTASKAYLYLATFEREGLVRQDPATGHYGFGPSIIRLGLAAIRQIDIVRLAREELDRLRERTGKPNVGFNLDSLHIFRSGATAADVKSVAPERVFIVQICDAPRTLAAGMDLPTESRTSRLYPGLGGLPLYDFLDTIPQDRDVIECETPYAPHRHLPAGERAKLAAAPMREFLKKYLRERRPMKAAPSTESPSIRGGGRRGDWLAQDIKEERDWR